MEKRISGPDLKNNYWLLYSLIFACVCVAVLFWFWNSGKTLIYNGDGWNQHYKALVYYSQYLRSGFSSFLNTGQAVFPNWEFALGEGNDVLAALHYYCIGDPFAFFSFLVPEKFMYVYYDAMIIARLYLAGASFSWLCLAAKRKKTAVLAGAFVYVFCTWMLHNICTHPYFLNPLIYLPLLVLGVEKIIAGKRPYVFFAAVLLSAVSNFYFLYMLAIFTLIYIAVRLISKYRGRAKEGLKVFGRLVLWAAAGCAAGAVILLPVLRFFLTDVRGSVENAVPLFYPAYYYSSLPSAFIAPERQYWMSMGFAAPALPAVFLLFRKKGNSLLKIFLILCIAFMIFPVFGHVTNGFSYITNRWSFAMALPVAYITVKMWEELQAVSGRDLKYLFLCFAGYAVLCAVCEYSSVPMALSSLVLILIFLMLLFFSLRTGGKHAKAVEKLCFAVLLVSIAGNAFWLFSPYGEDEASRGLEASYVKDEFHENEAAVIKKEESRSGTENVRFSGSRLTRNANLTEGLSSTQYCWTNSSPHLAEYRTALEVREEKAFSYYGYDERTALLALAGAGYYAKPDDDETEVPYGYREITPEDTGSEGYRYYKTEQTLPLVYGYKEYITRGEWDQLSAVDKEQTMLKTAVLEENTDSLVHGEAVTAGKELAYEAEYNENKIQLFEDRIVVGKADSAITFKIEGKPDSETYFNIKGLRFSDDTGETDDVRIRLKSSSGSVKNLNYLTEYAAQYNDRHDFCVNMGYSDEGITSIRARFYTPGTYRFDEIRIISRSMEDYGSLVNDLSDNLKADIRIGQDQVSVQAAADEKQMLVFSIPFSDGWRASVDGKETAICRVNVKNIGILLEEGDHNVVLFYNTPLLNIGIYITVAAFVIMGSFILVTERIRRKRR